jgi:hypothetical protein
MRVQGKCAEFNGEISLGPNLLTCISLTFYIWFIIIRSIISKQLLINSLGVTWNQNICHGQYMYWRLLLPKFKVRFNIIFSISVFHVMALQLTSFAYYVHICCSSYDAFPYWRYFSISLPPTQSSKHSKPVCISNCPATCWHIGRFVMMGWDWCLRTAATTSLLFIPGWL